MAQQLNIKNFKSSAGFVQAFCERNGLSHRKPTHCAQQTNLAPRELCEKVVEFFAEFDRLITSHSFENVVNMDETPIYVDPAVPRTIDMVGTKSVDIVNTGATKLRMTVVLTISERGEILPTYVLFKGFYIFFNSKIKLKTLDINNILKGLRRVPRCNFPIGIIGSANTSGTMNENLMLDYIDQVLVATYRGAKTLLIMDKFRAHCTEVVMNKLSENNIVPLFIPGKILNIF